MDCGHKCLKYLLFLFNFLFWVLGIVVLGVGIYSRIKSSNYDTLLGDGGISSAANILIASGIFVSLIGFVGCCGAIKESKPMLVIYFILVLLIFVLEIAAGILAYTKKDLMEEHLTKNLNTIVSENYGKTDTASKGMSKALDWFQEQVKCCGSNGPADWSTSYWNSTTTGLVGPKSCCKAAVASNADCNKELANLYPTGCVAAGKDFVKSHLWQVGGVGVGIAIIQVLVMAAACSLCRSIAKEGNLA